VLIQSYQFVRSFVRLFVLLLEGGAGVPGRRGVDQTAGHCPRQDALAKPEPQPSALVHRRHQQERRRVQIRLPVSPRVAYVPTFAEKTQISIPLPTFRPYGRLPSFASALPPT
jgi:hypothetical protein